MKNKFFIVTIFAVLLLNIKATFAQSGGQFKVLLFSKTDGFHHESIQEGVAAVRQLAARHTFSVDWHENASIFTDKGLENMPVLFS